MKIWTKSITKTFIDSRSCFIIFLEGEVEEGVLLMFGVWTVPHLAAENPSRSRGPQGFYEKWNFQNE